MWTWSTYGITAPFLLLAVLARLAPAGPVRYTVTDVGTPSGGTRSHASAINEAGQVVGSYVDADGANHAFLYEGHVIRE